MPKTDHRNGTKMVGDNQETDKMLSNGKTPKESSESEALSRDETEDKNKGLPIDRGWAWVVLGGTYHIIRD